MNYSACPSLSELADPSRRSGLQLHLDDCVRCRSLVRDMDTERAVPSASKAPRTLVAGSYVHGTATEPINDADVGAVVTASADDQDEFLLCALLDLDEYSAIAAPVSHEIAYATNWDLLLPATTVGYESMLEVWNQGTLLVEQIGGTVGRLTDQQLAQLHRLYEAAIAGERPPDEEAVGPPVAAEGDPRLLFQEAEFERARAHWIPASILAEAESLSGLVGLRMEAMGLSAAELEEALAAKGPDRAGWLERLRAGALDIYDAMPVAAMGDLLARLRVPRSRRALALVAESVYRTRAATNVPTASALARRRRGARIRVQAPSDEERRAAADQYTQALTKEWLE